MDLMNRIKQSKKYLKNNLVVASSRKKSLLLKYYQGLIVEDKLKLDNDYQKKKVIIEEDYQDFILKYQNILEHNNQNFIKYECFSKKYDNKQYWLRRKFKTKNSQDELLLQYDQTKKVEKEQFEKQLQKKYGLKPYSQETLNKAKQQISLAEEKAIQKQKQLDEKYKNLSDKYLQKIELINKKITKLVSDIEILNKKIIVFNALQLESERNEIAVLKETLALNNQTESAKELTQNKINRIQSKISMVDDEKIQLVVTNLKMYFGGIKAINDVSFYINQGEIFGLIGPNGAGKTTVFNCITQFYKATAGSIFYRNKENNIVDLNKLKTHNIVSEGIARSFQNVELIWELSVIDNLLVASHSHLLTSYFDHMFHTKKAIKEEEILKLKAFKILGDLNILEYAYRFPFGLPYGILKKTELARTLMTNPTMIILDEPAAGLNNLETIELGQIIKRINKEYAVTIFLVEHDMSLVMSICDRILAISFGKELATGTPKEIQNSEVVRVAYLGEDD